MLIGYCVFMSSSNQTPRTFWLRPTMIHTSHTRAPTLFSCPHRERAPGTTTMVHTKRRQSEPRAQAQSPPRGAIASPRYNLAPTLRCEPQAQPGPDKFAAARGVAHEAAQVLVVGQVLRRRQWMSAMDAGP